jgi:CTP:molybdopterin cytidylyltransferase MocA
MQEDMTEHIAGLVLAAGGGRRLGGRPKALLDRGGQPLVEHAVRVLREGGCGPVHVVLGAAADEVRSRARLDGCLITVNREWETGMGSSLRAGLGALAGGGASAAVVALVDQPGIGPESVRRLIGAYAAPSSLAAASYGGRRGHPLLLGADHWAGAAASARGDRGARGYLAAREESVRLVECGDVAAPYDIDTPEDLRRLATDGVAEATGATGIADAGGTDATVTE